MDEFIRNGGFLVEKRDKHIESVKAFVSPEPYPPIVVAGKNRLYAGLMHMNMCAAHSELTALMQYLYQSCAKSYHGNQ